MTKSKRTAELEMILRTRAPFLDREIYAAVQELIEFHKALDAKAFPTLPEIQETIKDLLLEARDRRSEAEKVGYMHESAFNEGHMSVLRELEKRLGFPFALLTEPKKYWRGPVGVPCTRKWEIRYDFFKFSKKPDRCTNWPFCSVCGNF